MPRWRELTGQTAEALLGLGWLDGVHPDDRERVGTAWAAAVRRAELFAIQYRVVGTDRTRGYDVRAAPVLDDAGAVDEWIGRVVDVTAQRETDERLQQALLPDQLPELNGIRTAVEYLPAVADVGVGGDWYDAVEVDSGRVLIVVGDVGGRGLEAATVMAQLRSAVRAYAVESEEPGEILSRVATYCDRLDLSDLVTVSVGLLDLVGHRLHIASAGHLPPVVRRPGEPAELVDLPGDPPLGTGRRRFRAREVELPPGSLLVLYTDGLVEERDRGLPESLAALCDAVTAVEGDSPDALCARLRAYATEGRPMSDDVALMVCMTDPVRDPAAQRMRAEPGAVARARRAAVDRVRELGGSARLVNAVRLAVSEAATNAVLHSGAEHLWVGVAAEGPQRLAVTVSDDGHGMRPRADSPGVGLGLPILSSLVDDFEIAEGPLGGTEVRMGFALVD